MNTVTIHGLKPAAVRALFRRHRGEQARLAERLGIARATLSRWLAGQFTSARIFAAVSARVEQMQQAEKWGAS